jgi:glycosyltransferase involved in cell wall biosynthesis
VSHRLSYATVTPARNEAANLARLADSMLTQTTVPAAWVIVDNGSTDGTRTLADGLAAKHSWIHVAAAPGEQEAVPGPPVVRAFHAGLAVLESFPDVIVKLDADVSFAAHHFSALLTAFEDDPTLGIAGSVCYELEEGEWRRQHVTGTHVRGAVRAYRRECLVDLLPLDDRMGWDTVDELKANANGWATRLIADIGFRHHRKVGERDQGRAARWHAQGRAAHYLGYRFGYLLLRSLYRARRDPAALAMIWAYVDAAVRREPVLADESARAYLRRQQGLLALPARMREARGRSA